MVQELEIFPGITISKRFAEELEEILDIYTIPEDDLMYPTESPSEIHLKEKTHRAYRREQAAKHRRIQYESLSHDPILKVEKSKRAKHRMDLVELCTHGGYAESSHESSNLMSEYPAISEIFKMPYLKIGQSPMSLGDPKNPGTNRGLEGLVKYGPQAIGPELKARPAYTH